METLEITEVNTRPVLGAGDSLLARLEAQLALHSAPESNVPADYIAEAEVSAGVSPTETPLAEEKPQPGLFERTGNFLFSTKVGKLATAAAVTLSIATAYSLATPDKAKAETVCTTSPGGDSTICTTTPDTPPAQGGDEQDPGNDGKNDDGHHKPDKPHHGKHHQDGNLLPLPKHHTNRYWSTMILNEIRQGKKGRISASKPAQHSLYQTRKGRCTPVEMVPGACVKLDKTLLETLYKASQVMRYRINYTVSGNHVTCSDHYQGRGADLMRWDDSAPHNRRLLHIFDHVLHGLPGHHTAQLLGPGDEGHSGANAHWHIGITGSNNICE